MYIYFGLFGKFCKLKLLFGELKGVVCVCFIGFSYVVDINGLNICEVFDVFELLVFVGCIGLDVFRVDVDLD